MKKIQQLEIIKFLEKKYPLKNAQDWDFVGYSLKFNNKYVKKILICLDVNNKVVTEAIKNKVELIISYHPFKFGSSWKTIYSYDKNKKKLVQRLTNHKISVYSIHTNLDVDSKGTNYLLLKKLEWHEKIIKDFDFASIVSFSDSFKNLISLLKYKLKINTVITNNTNLSKMIKKIYIQSGAGDIYEFLKQNEKNKVDVLITSDIKWNEQQLLNSLGINYIMIPHKTEDVVVNFLATLLNDQFNSNIKTFEYLEEDFNKGY